MFHVEQRRMDYHLHTLHSMDGRQTVDELCANYSLSRPTILKAFKKRTGVSIVEYKAQQRLLVAARMLSEGNMSVTDISSGLGYDSLSYFLRAFKKKYGMTPTEYRKHCKRNT